MAEIYFNVVTGTQETTVLRPTYEGVPVPDQVELIRTSTDKQDKVSFLDLVRNGETNEVLLKIDGVVSGVIECDVIIKYTGNDSYVENVGISTKKARIGVQTPGEPSIVIENGTVVGSSNNRFYFKLYDSDGNPINNAQFVSMDITKNPSNKYILSGWGNGIYPVNAGNTNEYWISLNTSPEPGEFTVVLTISIPGTDGNITLPPMTFMSPGSPLIIVVDPTTVTAVVDEITDISLIMTQAVYSTGVVPASGSITNVTITGPATLTESITETTTKGTYSVKLKSTGQKGTVKVSGSYLKNDDSLNYSKVSFSFIVKYT